jgi:phosphatidylinositol phospholipase C delta
VKLLRCLRAIKEFAFQVSEYPVVITFEDHLTANLQDKVAKVRVNLYHGILCSCIAGMVSSVPLV